jgi:hypothetical protein
MSGLADNDLVHHSITAHTDLSRHDRNDEGDRSHRVLEAGGGPAMRHERNARRDQERSDAEARVADENASGMPMERAVRAATAAVGAASLAVGTVAVFQTQNGAGSAALLAVGAVLLVLAGVGRWPKRMTLGDASIEFPGGEVTSIADGAAERGDLKRFAE